MSGETPHEVVEISDDDEKKPSEDLEIFMDVADRSGHLSQNSYDVVAGESKRDLQAPGAGLRAVRAE
jgi:hypothetical protein